MREGLRASLENTVWDSRLMSNDAENSAHFRASPNLHSNATRLCNSGFDQTRPHAWRGRDEVANLIGFMQVPE